MSEQYTKSWKLILGSKTREIKDVKSGKSRTDKVYEIVTSDGKQLILGSYVKLQSIDELSESKVARLLEIEGEFYDGFGSQSYHPNLHYAVKQYLTENHILSPKKDIIKIEDAVQLYVDAEKEFKRLCDLGAKK